MKQSDRITRHDEIRAQLDGGSSRRALEAAETLTREAPDDPDAHVLLARAQLLADDPLRALRSAQRAIELDERMPESHALAGAAFLALGRLRDAVLALERSLALEPTRLSTRLHLAQALLDEGRAREAFDALAPIRKSDARTERESSELFALLDRIERSEPDPRVASFRDGIALHAPRIARVSVGAPVARSEARASLAALGRDLTVLARDGALDPVYGRDAEIDAVIDVLLRRQKPNPILTGPAGVGKTAVVEALAQRIARGSVPERLRGIRVVEISVAALVAGTSYRGELEARLRALLDEARSDRSIVLAIDEIHTLVGAGGMGSELDASEILKPALARGDLRVIGATTDADFERVIAHDATLSRRFTRITVSEPDLGSATTIARAVAHDLATFHGVRFDEAVPREAVVLSMRHLPSRRLPDKAIDLLDQSAVLATRAGRATVTREDLHVALSRLASIPLALVRDPLGAHADLETRLARVVVGQPDACAAIARRTLMHATRDAPSRPLTFVFEGPRGVGKSAAIHAYAAALGVPCVVVDLVDFGESHDLARLAGAPAGYLGHDEPSAFVQTLRTTPAAVLAFEDADRAHARVLASLARWIETGTITDARGEHCDLRHTTVVFTITADHARAPAGFARSATVASAPVSGELPTSLRTVADEIVRFHALSRQALVTIAERRVRDATESWSRAGHAVTVAEDLCAAIVDTASPRADAREIVASIERSVVGAVATAFARGARHVHVEWQGRVVVEEVERAEPRARRKRDKA
jgi:ATP-dependent Clp protease ATP-binding subunit ClpA